MAERAVLEKGSPAWYVEQWKSELRTLVDLGVVRIDGEQVIVVDAQRMNGLRVNYSPWKPIDASAMLAMGQLVVEIAQAGLLDNLILSYLSTVDPNAITGEVLYQIQMIRRYR